MFIKEFLKYPCKPSVVRKPRKFSCVDNSSVSLFPAFNAKSISFFVKSRFRSLLLMFKLSLILIEFMFKLFLNILFILSIKGLLKEIEFKGYGKCLDKPKPAKVEPKNEEPKRKTQVQPKRERR